MAENTAVETVETFTLEEMQAKLAKAEAKIVELKNSQKAETNSEEEKEEVKVPTFWKEEVEAMIKEALKANAINAQEDEYRQNQNETNSASVGNEEAVSSSSFNTLSIDDYSKLSPSGQREYIRNSTEKLWEVSFA